MEELRENPHFRLVMHRKSKPQYLAPRACTHLSFLQFFCMPIAREPKKCLEVRATAVRERVNDEPRDGAAATQHRTRVTTQPSCEFVLVWTRSLCLETSRLGLGK